MGTITNLQIVLNTQINPYLNQATKNHFPNFSNPPPPPHPHQKNPKSKISNPKKSFDHPCHLKSGVPPPPPRGELTVHKESVVVEEIKEVDVRSRRAQFIS